MLKKLYDDGERPPRLRTNADAGVGPRLLQLRIVGSLRIDALRNYAIIVALPLLGKMPTLWD